MEKLKIQYVVSFPLGAHGGHQGASREKIAAFRQLGHTVEVNSCSDDIYLFSKAAALLLTEIKAAFSFLRFKPDIVISRGYVGVLVFCLARSSRAIFVREVHSDAWGEARLLAKGWQRTLLYLAAFYASCLDRFADRVIFNHPTLMEHYVQASGFQRSRCAWFYNGVSKDKILSDSEARTNRNGPLVFVGNVSAWHGIDAMLDLYGRARGLGLLNELIIVGPVRCKLPARVPSGVTFTGPLPNPNVQKIIESASACLLPVSDIRVSPGSPLKLYEYLAKAKLVITQQGVLGYSDEVEKYECGVGLDFTQVDKAAKDLVHLIRAGELDSGAVLRRVRSFATWESVVQRWLDFVCPPERVVR